MLNFYPRSMLLISFYCVSFYLFAITFVEHFFKLFMIIFIIERKKRSFLFVHVEA
jgi:hypothetical protein